MSGWGIDEWGLSPWGSEVQPDASVTLTTVAAVADIPTPTVEVDANISITTTTVTATASVAGPFINGIGQAERRKRPLRDDLYYYGLTRRSRTPGYVRGPRQHV